MTQARSGAVRIAVAQVIWSSPAGHWPHDRRRGRGMDRVQGIVRNQLIVPGQSGPACRPEGSRSAASPEHSRRPWARRLPSRPRSRTDERARCPQWFSAVSAVSDRTGCSTASNWSKDPRSTVRPAQRSVMPRSARSCRRARTVTADGMALPREQCVGSRRRQATGRRSQVWRFC